MNYSIAILLTCHNRKEKTLKCLKSVFSCTNSDFDVWLVDDGSTDGTSEAIYKEFPDVKILNGNGNLFWNMGMRFAWQNASSYKEYDFYIWLNDDTYIFENAIKCLIEDYEFVKNKLDKEAVIVGSCCESESERTFSYGGRIFKTPVLPNGKPKECNYINGNFVLVSNKIYRKVGILSQNFTHAIGDIDYGLRVIDKGYSCFTSSNYLAICETNKGLAAWCNPEVGLKQRLKLANSPLGINVKEYVFFVRRHFGFLKSKITYCKVYFRVFFPKVFLYIKK